MNVHAGISMRDCSMPDQEIDKNQQVCANKHIVQGSSMTLIDRNQP